MIEAAEVEASVDQAIDTTTNVPAGIPDAKSMAIQALPSDSDSAENVDENEDEVENE